MDSSSGDFYQSVIVCGELAITEYGTLEGNTKTASMIGYNLFYVVNDESIYFEKGDLDIDTFDKTVKDANLGVSSQIISSRNSLGFWNALDYALFNYQYNSQTGFYETESFDEKISIGIENGEITYLYDGRAFSTLSKNLCAVWANLDNIKTPASEINGN